MDRTALTRRDGRKRPAAVEPTPLSTTDNHPIRYIVDRVSASEPLQHIVALDVNVDGVHILEAAKRSAECRCAVTLPLKDVGAP